MFKLFPPLPAMFLASAMLAMGAAPAPAQVRVILKPSQSAPEAGPSVTAPAIYKAPGRVEAAPAPAPSPSSMPANAAPPPGMSAAQAKGAGVAPAASAPVVSNAAEPVSDTAEAVSETAPDGPLASQKLAAPAASEEGVETAPAALQPKQSKGKVAAAGSEKPVAARAPVPRAAGGKEAALYEPSVNPKRGDKRETPSGFRERCSADGGAMAGGGKFGFCILR